MEVDAAGAGRRIVGGGRLRQSLGVRPYARVNARVNASFVV